MSKKKITEMEKEQPRFLSGAKDKKIPEQKAQRIWEQMEKFAEYGFNKSHSTAYAMISYQTAYLKAHYPVEFMAALLTSEKDNRDKIIKYIGVCREMGIQVLPPDINESERDFSVAGEYIRFGLSGVKNVGLGAIETIIHAHDAGGKFQSLFDFCSRVDLRKVNRRVIESLIKCGAFDAMGRRRRPLFAFLDELTDRVQVKQREKESRQVNIFTDMERTEGAGEFITDDEIPDLPEWDHKELLSFEKDTLGFYITGHPLSKYTEQLMSLANADSSSLIEKKDKDMVAVGGIVSSLREIKTKKKDTMAYVVIEDLKGSFETIFFADVYRQAFDLLHSDDPILIRGSVDIGEESVKVIAADVSLLQDALGQPFDSVHFHLSVQQNTVEVLDSLRHLLADNYPGKYEGYLHFHDDQSEAVVSLGSEIRIAISAQLQKEADQLIGRRGATEFH